MLAAASFDHLVSAGEEGWWDREAESLGCLQVDRQRRLIDGLDGKIAGKAADEKPGDVARKAKPVLAKVRPVTRERAASHDTEFVCHSWYAQSECCLDNHCRVGGDQGVGNKKESLHIGGGEGAHTVAHPFRDANLVRRHIDA